MEELGNIAHQWRQPLNNIGLLMQGTLHECKEGSADQSSFATCANRCMELISYMSKTINVFQSFFMTGERREFDPYEIVEKSVSLVRASYEEAGIVICVDNQGTLPIFGFDVDFSQVILNVLNNARDVLLERGTPNPAVEISCFCEDGTVVIAIVDNAGGIPEDIIDKIFDPYYTTKFKSQGTGLGLYMSKIIIEKNMGGRLKVRNAEVGAEFSIELPAKEKQDISAQ